MCYSGGNLRSPDNITLTRILFHNWQNTLDVSENVNEVNMAGPFPGTGKVMWYNFIGYVDHMFRNVKIKDSFEGRYYY